MEESGAVEPRARAPCRDPPARARAHRGAAGAPRHRARRRHRLARGAARSRCSPRPSRSCTRRRNGAGPCRRSPPARRCRGRCSTSASARCSASRRSATSPSGGCTSPRSCSPPPTSRVFAIARRVGYDSEEAFSRAFKRARGLSPSHWRAARALTRRRRPRRVPTLRRPRHAVVAVGLARARGTRPGRRRPAASARRDRRRRGRTGRAPGPSPGPAPSGPRRPPCPRAAASSPRSRGSSSWSGTSGTRLPTEIASSVISRSSGWSASADCASPTPISASERVAESAAGSVTERVTDCMPDEAHPHRDRAPGPLLGPQPGRDPVGEEAELDPQHLVVDPPAPERRLRAHRPGAPGRLDAARVGVRRASAPSFVAVGPTEQVPQHRRRRPARARRSSRCRATRAARASPGRRPRAGRPAAGRGTPPPSRPRTTTRPSGLATCDATLARCFVVATPTEIGRPSSVRTRCADLGGHRRRRTEEVHRSGDVEERLVDRDPLDERREVVEHLHHRVAEALVLRKWPPANAQARAELPGPPAGHPGVDAVRLRLVRRREHHAAADRDRPPGRRGIEQLLHRGVERVEVGVQDRAPGPARVAVGDRPVHAAQR